MSTAVICGSKNIEYACLACSLVAAWGPVVTIDVIIHNSA